MVHPVTAASLLLLDGAAQTAVGAKAEHLVLRLLIQLLVILVATRATTALVRRLGQTDVSGEILAGILLGPSLLGAVWPSLSAQVFVPETAPIFVGLAQVGLVLLMFQIGLEFEFGAHLGADLKPVTVISAVGIAVPFTLGYLFAPWFWGQLPDPRPDLYGFRLFFAVAMSITAIPILGRIFMELGLSHTRTAALTIGAAAIDDVAGWMILGAIALLARGRFSLAWALPRLAGIVIFLVGVFVVLRPRLKRALDRELASTGGELRPAAVAWVLVVLFASAVVTSSLGIFAIIGGFAVGVALHDDRRFVDEWKRRVSPLVTTLLLPVFFAYTGLRTDVGSLHGLRGAATCALVCAVAFGSKFGGAYIAARALGESNRRAITVGVCMNTRALMELIVLNIGKDMGLLPTEMFTMLVIMAIVSTFMTTPLVRRLMRDERRAYSP